MFLPESLDISAVDETLTVWEQINRMGGVKKQFVDLAVVFRTYLSPTFVCILAIMCTLTMALTGRSLFFYYVSYRFGWDSQDEGQYTVVSSISRMVHMLVTFPILKLVFAKSILNPRKKALFDISLIRLGVLIMAGSQLMFAMATNGNAMYIISFFDAIGILCSPTARALLSSSVPSDSQGLLFSGISSVEHIFSMTSSILFPLVWGATVNSAPNTFFFLISALLFVGFGFSLMLTSKNIVDSIIVQEPSGDEIPQV